jgi:hypothetical protein
MEKQKFLGRNIRLFTLIRHESHRKRCVQQLLYCCVCICYHDKVFTEPLPSKDTETLTEVLPTNDGRDL